MYGALKFGYSTVHNRSIKRVPKNLLKAIPCNSTCTIKHSDPIDQTLCKSQCRWRDNYFSRGFYEILIKTG